MLHWFARKLKEAQENEKGFTLIELLVVVIIIGILAAIAIPTFLAQRSKAWDASAQADARNGSDAATNYASDHNGLYTGMDAATLKAAPYNWHITPGNTGETATPKNSDKDYTITVKSQSGKTATFDSATGTVTLA